MRLVRIQLQNFPQHAGTTIEFRRGLTGIIGPNGAGKSTILEAIGWAIYGSSAIRGTNDTLRFARAPGRSRVQVELVFELAGHEYRVVRTLNSAEVFLDGSTAPVATSIGGVTQYLERRLGMSREEFFNTYFTGQNELQFLAQMGAAQRGRFLSQVLGYERLRLAQERARQRRNELRHAAEGLRAGLPDPDALRAERTAAERRRKEAAAAVREAEKAARAAAERALELAPRWQAMQAARDQDRELAHALGIARTELEAAERDAARARSDLEAAVAADAELAGARGELAALPTVVQAGAADGAAARAGGQRAGAAGRAEGGRAAARGGRAGARARGAVRPRAGGSEARAGRGRAGGGRAARGLGAEEGRGADAARDVPQAGAGAEGADADAQAGGARGDLPDLRAAAGRGVRARVRAAARRVGGAGAGRQVAAPAREAAHRQAGRPGAGGVAPRGRARRRRGECAPPRALPAGGAGA